MIRHPVRAFCLAGALLALALPAASQTPAAKRPLTHKDYDSWRSIGAPVLSPDGAYLAYSLGAAEGDGELVVRDLNSGKEIRQNRGGGRGGPALPPALAARLGGRLPAISASHAFSSDGKIVLFTIAPGKADKTKGKGAPPGSALGLLELASGKVTRLDKVRAFQVPQEGRSLVVYHRGTAPVAGGEGAKGKAKAKGRPTLPIPADAGTTAPLAPTGSELVLRDLATAKERTFSDVTNFSLTRDGQWLVYVTAPKKDDKKEDKKDEGGVYAVATASESTPVVLRNAAGRYSGLTWDEKQEQLVFFQTKPANPNEKGSRPAVRICHWKRPATSTAAALPGPMPGTGTLAAPTLVALQMGGTPATDLEPAGKPAFQDGYDFSDQGGLRFSRDGSRVYFNVAKPPEAPKPIGSQAVGEQKAVVELWHHDDDFIQPMQKVRYAANRSYQAVFHLADRSCRQLADEALASVDPMANEWAVGTDGRSYRRLVGGQEAGNLMDVYLLNLKTGQKKLVLKKHSGAMTASPEGKYLLSFDGKSWFAQAVPDGKRVNLTAKLGVKFASELWDTPGQAPPYGVAGWTKDDKQVLLYDRYDLWAVAPDGSGGRNLTGSLGRKTTTQLRAVRLDARERAFDPAKPLLMRAENERTRDTGFYRVPFDGAPKLLIMGARNYGTPVKAAKGDRLILTVSTFYDYPDLYSTDLDFREIKRVTDANPQKKDFVWGKAEMIEYKTSDGDAMNAVLIKPENFDPNKKYPMIVYIYERLSQGLHGYRSPSAGTSINPTYYASNGYLVLMPDIAYDIGRPGQSAVKCVLPAVQSVVDKGFVNEKAIGIQGHSWGGYQTAYLITQSNRFKAASAGAPVSNMTSAYGGIRWGTGLPRQFQYEKTQSRIGATLWEAPGKFIENSPLFYADRIKTPLIMLHNDKDEAVPWQEGIQYYLALRRLNKEVYLFNYPGEGHGLRQRVNQRDYTIRMQEFFDHHLKGAAKPEWMKKGLPYTPPPAAGGATTPAGGGPGRRTGRG